MNGLPGKMGYSCAEACVARGMTLADVALTGEPFAGTPTDDRIPKVDLVAGGSDEAEKRGAARAWAAATRARARAQRAGAIYAYKMSYFATASLQERCTVAVYSSLAFNFWEVS